MKRVHLADDWKDSWKYSYPYDLLEIYGETDHHIGYAYAYRNRRDSTLSLVESVLKKGDTILDVAAAQGNFSLKLAEMGYAVTWNDIREELIDYVKMKHEFGQVDYRPGNVFDINFKQPFDLVLATEIIEHVAHPDEFLKNISALAKPGGHIVISTPLGSYFKNDLPKFSEFADPSIFEARQFGPNSEDHIFLLHIEEIKTLAAQAGLEVSKVSYYTNPLTNGHVKLNRLLEILPESLVFSIEGITQRLPYSIGKKIHSGFSVLMRKVN